MSQAEELYANNYSAVDSEGISATINQLMLSIDGGDYEPYTGGKPSPSPEYPQEIVSIENPTVSVYGKNLLDISAGLNDVLVVDTDGVYTITKFDDYNRFSNKMPLLIPARTKFVFSYTGLESTGNYPVQLQVIFRDGTDTTAPSGRWIAYDKDIVAARIYISIADDIGVYGRFKDPQVEIGNIQTAYEPYVSSKTLCITNTLPGIPVSSGGNYTDENGQQWICDEVDLERGVYVQRIGRLTLTGEDNWGAYTYVDRYFGFSVPELLDEQCSRNPGFCNQFINLDQRQDDTVWVGVTNKSLYVINREWYDKGLGAWKAHLDEHPLEIIYVRTNPIETPLNAEEITAFKALRTNHPNTTILNDAGAWMSVKYNADTKAYVENPRILKLVDSSTGVVYELKIVDGNLTVVPV